MDGTKKVGTAQSAYFYYYITRNSLLFWRRHTSFLNGIRASYRNIRRARRSAKKLKAMGHRIEATSIWLGIVDGLFGRGGQWRMHPD